MSFVITDRCVGSKDTSCYEVCPVDCIHPSPDEADFAIVTQLYVNPDECIDCGACQTACPVDAVMPLDDVPGSLSGAIRLNRAYFA